MISSTIEDILEVDAPAVVVHQVNCLGYGSMGLMARIMKKWPDVFKQYHELCGWFKDRKHQHEMLGYLQAIPLPKTKLILCNAFSQKFLSDTKYEAVPDAWNTIMHKVAAQVQQNFNKTGVLYEVHCPAKIGVGMAIDELEELKGIVADNFADSAIKWIYHE